MRTAHLIGPVMGLAIVTAAQAGRPLVTEDAGVLDAGDCELESFAGRWREPGVPRTDLQSVQLGCGALEGTQVALLAQRASSGSNPTSRYLTVAGKTRVWGAEDQATVTLAWGLGHTDDGTGRGLRLDTSYLNGVVTWPLAKDLNLHGNLGWNRYRLARQTRTSWAVALEHATTDTVDLMAELFDDDRTQAPWVQAGLRWNAVPEKLWIDTSIGWQTGGIRGRAFTVGLRFAF